MAATIGGVTCQEIVADLSESFDRLAGPQFRKGWLCAWGSRLQVAQGLLGLSSTTSIGGAITLQTPLSYPDLSTAYATRIDIQPVGPPVQGTNQVAYTYAIVWASYGALPWSFAALGYQQIDPTHPYIWAEQSISFTSEWITVPGTNVFYSGTGKQLLDQDWGFRSPIMNFTVSLKNVPYMPTTAALTASAAPINSATYFGCTAGHLLFNGLETHQSFTSDGTYTQTCDFSFSYRPIAPWDYVYGPAGWDRVVDGSSNPIQTRSDLSTIIPSAYI